MTTSSGRLSVVATPIGNLEDITLRALRTLEEAETILAEDTRHTRRLLEHHAIRTPLRALHAHTNPARIDEFVAALLTGAHYALVSDAGTPLISDPGAGLVEKASDAGVRIEPIPGPSAVTAALTVAAIPCGEFRFVGFLPRKGARRRQAIDRIVHSDATTVLFEAPTRLPGTLRDLEAAVPTRRIAVCRELTKMHEQIARGVPSELLEHFEAGTKGELTLIVEGSSESTEERRWTDEEVDARIRELRADSRSAAEVARTVAKESGRPRREVWDRIVTVEG